MAVALRGLLDVGDLEYSTWEIWIADMLASKSPLP